MSVAIAIISIENPANLVRIRGTLTPSGTYPANGDSIDFTGLIPSPSGGTFLTGPDWMEISNPTGFALKLSQSFRGALAVTKLLLFGAPAGTTGVAATNTVTSNNTIVTAADTVTVNGKVYTFRATPSVEGDVHVITDADTSLGNLAAAINHTGTPGTDYFCAAANPDVSSSAVASHVITLTALTKGTAGNALTLAKSAATLSVGAATFSGGVALGAVADAGKSDWPTTTAIPFKAEFYVNR